jgi:hypothetical protein
MSIQPHRGATHVITIPGTSYVCHMDSSYMEPQFSGSTAKPPRVEALMKALARTTVSSIGKRRVKAVPILRTIEEFQALTTAKAA